MDIGLFAALANPVATPSYLRTLGRAAEERGFHSIWVAEHVVLFDEYRSAYPYAPDGRLPAPPECGILDPFTSLSFLAGVTDRIRLGTGVCLVPQRHPVYTAKEVATLDWLSNGRVDFGVGVGWLEEEFDALGVPFARRGARCRAYLEVMRRLWTDPVSRYEGEFYALRDCRHYPKPVQTPHPPIHFGGESDAALRRVADLGQGWYGFGFEPEEGARHLQRLDRLLEARGRRRGELTLSVCPYLRPPDADLVRRYRDVGFDQVILFVVAFTDDDLLATLDLFANQIAVPASAW